MYLLILLALIGLGLAVPEPPTRYIDYSDCEWRYGSATDKVNCNTGYVGVGACGNKGQTRCNNRAFGIECCKIRSGGGPYECQELYGNKGNDVTCPFSTQVFGTCGSLDMSRCSHGGLKCITINCCSSDLRLTSECSWTYASNQGEHLSCNKWSGGEQVLTGRCGSETMAQCGGSNVHGIRCCDLA